MKSILFNTEMVQAIINGGKSQTRIPIKPQPTNPRYNNLGWLGWEDGRGYRMKQPCDIGGILWVRETWDNIPVSPEGNVHIGGMYYYKADGDLRPVGWHGNWNPSVHMPRAAARIFLLVTNVRLERLQDITPDQAKKEGVRSFFTGMGERGYAVKADSKAFYDGPIGAFAGFWDSSIKPSDRDTYSWGANPWVWTVTFDKIDKPKGWQ